MKTSVLMIALVCSLAGAGGTAAAATGDSAAPNPRIRFVSQPVAGGQAVTPNPRIRYGGRPNPRISWCIKAGRAPVRSCLDPAISRVA